MVDGRAPACGMEQFAPAAVVFVWEGEEVSSWTSVCRPAVVLRSPSGLRPLGNDAKGDLNRPEDDDPR